MFNGQISQYIKFLAEVVIRMSEKMNWMNVLGLLPRQPIPILDLTLTAGGQIILEATLGDLFDLIVYYCGLHRPPCTKYLAALE